MSYSKGYDDLFSAAVAGAGVDITFDKYESDVKSFIKKNVISIYESPILTSGLDNHDSEIASPFLFSSNVGPNNKSVLDFIATSFRLSFIALESGVWSKGKPVMDKILYATKHYIDRPHIIIRKQKIEGSDRKIRHEYKYLLSKFGDGYHYQSDDTFQQLLSFPPKYWRGDSKYERVVSDDLSDFVQVVAMPNLNGRPVQDPLVYPIQEEDIEFDEDIGRKMVDRYGHLYKGVLRDAIDKSLTVDVRNVRNPITVPRASYDLEARIQSIVETTSFPSEVKGLYIIVYRKGDLETGDDKLGQSFQAIETDEKLTVGELIRISMWFTKYYGYVTIVNSMPVFVYFDIYNFRRIDDNRFMVLGYSVSNPATKELVKLMKDNLRDTRPWVKQVNDDFDYFSREIDDDPESEDES